MTTLHASQLKHHITSCLSGGEFPCHVALDHPHDPLWDDDKLPLNRLFTYGSMSPRHPAAGDYYDQRNAQAEF